MESSHRMCIGEPSQASFVINIIFEVSDYIAVPLWRGQFSQKY